MHSRIINHICVRVPLAAFRVGLLIAITGSLVAKSQLPLVTHSHPASSTLSSVYQHAFRVQGKLEQLSASREYTSDSSTNFRHQLQFRFGLSDEEFAAFEESTLRYAAIEDMVRSHIRAIAESDKLARPVSGGLSAMARISIRSLIAQRGQAASYEIVTLHQTLGSLMAQRLDDAVVTLYSEAQQVRTHNATNPSLVAKPLGSSGVAGKNPNVICLECGPIGGDDDDDDDDDGGGGGGSSPPTSSCFAQLKYRPVYATIGGIQVQVANHSFWYFQDVTETQEIADAGPQYATCSPVSNCGYLVDWVTEGTVGHYPEDNTSASTWFDSGVSGEFCSQVESLEEYAIDWPQSTYSYAIGRSPNSNTFAHNLATAGGFAATQPPSAKGW